MDVNSIAVVHIVVNRYRIVEKQYHASNLAMVSEKEKKVLQRMTILSVSSFYVLLQWMTIFLMSDHYFLQNTILIKCFYTFFRIHFVHYS